LLRCKIIIDYLLQSVKKKVEKFLLPGCDGLLAWGSGLLQKQKT
jgi:hypothetical protein